MSDLPLLVHLIFHPESTEARDLARHVHRQLNGDLLVPGLRLPTVFCPRQAGGPPDRLNFNLAERNFIVVLAEDRLTIDPDWSRFCGDTWTACAGDSARFLPLQLSENAYPIDPRLATVSFPKAYLQKAGQARNAFVVRRIVVELCRYLSNLEEAAASQFEAPITIFLSHTKADLNKEPKVTQQFIESLKQDQPIEAWVDSGDIPGGSKFAEAIAHGIERTSLLAVLTDAYATREWCREEILLAKENRRPVVVVDALTDYEVRSFPYLGNVPRLRWDGDPQEGIDLLLKETLRHLQTHAVLQRSQQPGDVLFTRPPEMATLAGLDPSATVLYPDPPIGVGEARRLEKIKVRITTPLQRLARERPLKKGTTVALSLSESTDIENRGLDPLHLESCMIDLSRHLLVQNATLAYGGHIGKESFTQLLYELVRTHNNLEGVQPYQRIVNFRGWPLPRLEVAELARLHAAVTTVELPRPADIDETLHADFIPKPACFFSADQSPQHRFAWARGMSEMRAYQADRTRSGVAARVVIGGVFGPTVKASEDPGKPSQLQWYESRIPGVLEEIVLSVEAGQPVFLIGAFGGVARMVIDLIRGEDREEASWEFQKGAPHAPEMKALYLQRGIPWMDYPEIVAFLRSKGRSGINPLLQDAEQDELFETVNPARMVELIVKGLDRLP